MHGVGHLVPGCHRSACYALPHAPRIGSDIVCIGMPSIQAVAEAAFFRHQSAQGKLQTRTCSSHPNHFLDWNPGLRFCFRLMILGPISGPTATPSCQRASPSSTGATDCLVIFRDSTRIYNLLLSLSPFSAILNSPWYAPMVKTSSSVKTIWR